MQKWLESLLRPRDRFSIPAGQGKLPRCRIRRVRKRDFAACESIYRLNEPERFPKGYFGLFSTWLRKRRDLIAVVEADRRVVAVGGIYIVAQADVAVLVFGMVHPGYRKRGFGTALLFARLSALPTPDPYYPVVLSTVGGSDSFYRRFGFRAIGRTADEKGRMFDNHRMHLYRNDWEVCRAALRRASVVVHLAEAAAPSRVQ